MALHDGNPHKLCDYTAAPMYVAKGAVAKACDLNDDLRALPLRDLVELLRYTADHGEEADPPLDDIGDATGRLLPLDYLTPHGDRIVVLRTRDKVLPRQWMVPTVKPLRACYRRVHTTEDNEGQRDLRSYLDATGHTPAEIATRTDSDVVSIERLLQGAEPRLKLALALQEELDIAPAAWLERRCAS